MSSLALRYALRELRGGLRGFRILMACLALGVTAIAGAGSLDSGVRQAIARDARALLGGDLEIRRSYLPLEAGQRAFLRQFGDVSEISEMRGMVAVLPSENESDGSLEGDAASFASRTLVEVKAVDAAYPLYGALETSPSLPLAEIVAEREGRWGAAVERGLLDRLGLVVGSEVTLGLAHFQIRAIIDREPDRVASILSFGPRFLIAAEALPKTGLIQPGALIRQAAFLRLAPGQDGDEVSADWRKAYPDGGFQLRKAGDAAPGLGRFLDNLATFLTLVGLSSLLVGGIGVANAVKAFLDGKLRTIAILKSLGASGALVRAVYLIQIGLLAGGGILAGVLAGALVPFLTLQLVGSWLPLPLTLGFYPRPLAEAAGFGLLTALTFGLWPLLRATRLPPAELWRVAAGGGGERNPSGKRFSAAQWAAAALVAVAGAALAALAILTSGNPQLAGGFVVAAAAALLLFGVLAHLIALIAEHLAHSQIGKGRPLWRLGLANLHRPGAPTGSVVLSFGLGLSVLLAVALVQANLSRQLDERLPGLAPTFFFIDVQPDQIEPFEQIVREADPEAVVEKAASVRGRITLIDGRPVEEKRVGEDARWAVQSDRGLTSAAQPPRGTRIVAGQWWDEAYRGPPLVSIDAKIAKGLGLGLGSRVSLNVLGHELTAQVASLREIDWSSLGMNFTFILSPGALEGAPMTWIATVRVRPDHEAAVERAVGKALPNVSSIRVKEGLDSVRAVLTAAGWAIRAAAVMVLGAGVLVLSGAVIASRTQRLRDAVILKAVGATRRDLWRAFLVEFGALGLGSCLLAAGVGSLCSWAILHFVMHLDWSPALLTLGGTSLAALALMLLLGYLGTARALAAKVAPQLRNE